MLPDPTKESIVKLYSVLVLLEVAEDNPSHPSPDDVAKDVHNRYANAETEEFGLTLSHVQVTEVNL